MADDTLQILFEIDSKLAQLDALDGRLGRIEKLVPSVDSKLHGVGDTLEHVGKKAHGAAEGLKHHEEGFRGIGETVKGAHSKLIEFAEFAGIALALEGVHLLAEAFTELGSDILNAAAAEERVGLAFKLNLGDKLGEEALAYGEQFSKFGEFTEDQSKLFEGALLQAGVPFEKLDMYMAAAGDTAAKSTNKMEGMMTAIEALSRAELSGKLEGRALRGLHIGIPQLKELDEFRGKSDKQIRDFLEKGTLTKAQLFRAIAGPDNVLGDSAERAGGTMLSKIDKLKALPERLFQGFMNSSAFDGLKGRIDEVLEKFDPNSPGGQAIIAGIGKIGDEFLKLTESIDLDDVLNGILSVIHEMPDALRAVKEVFDLIAGTAHEIHKAVSFIVDHTPGGGDLYKVAAHAAAGGGTSALEELGNLGYIDKAKDAVRGFFGMGKSTADGMAGGLGAGKGDVAMSASDLASTAVDAVQSKLDLHSPSRVFHRIGEMTAEGFVRGFSSRSADIDDTMSDAFAVPSPGSGGGVGLGGVQVASEINVNVTAGGGDGRDIGEQVAAAVRDVLPTALIRALTRIQAQQGSA